MKKKRYVLGMIVFSTLAIFFGGCQMVGRSSEDFYVESKSETDIGIKQTQGTNDTLNEDWSALSLTGRLTDDIIQLCDLEKDQGVPMGIHDIDGESVLIIFGEKEKSGTYSYILSEQQEIIRLEEFSSGGNWADLKLTSDGAQGYSREEGTVEAFSWRKGKITDQEKIVVSNQYTMTPNLLYAYTDDFKMKAFAKTNENWTQELIIKDMGTGAEQVVRTYQTDTTAIKQILELTDFYFLNSNQLFYVGLYYPAEGKQGQQGYGIIDLTSEQKDSMYEGNVTLRSETGCIVVLEEDYLFKEGKPTGKVLIYQRKNESWITVTLPDSEKMSSEICISRSGKYLLVPYFERTTETWEGRLFESATGKMISTIDMNLENGTQKMIENFCILEDQGQVLYFNSNGTVEVITF